MNDIRIKDLSRVELMQEEFDLAIFSVGYEPRCTNLISLLDEQKINNSFVLSYEESKSEDVHAESLNMFSNYGLTDFVYLNHSDIKEVYSKLIDKITSLSKGKRLINVLIDYSSMSRNWYAAILNYLLNYFEEPLKITMVYSCAEYPLNSDFLDFELGDVKVLPGCQGSSITKRKTAGIFMLGFDRIGPLSFYNLLEPDLAYGIISSPGSLPDYEQQAKDLNANFPFRLFLSVF